MRLLTFLLLIPALAFGQSLHTFENGQVADAQKINENFSYVLENASGGCTVEQVDNSAQITCADGTSAVVPGYGTVMVIPEGITGEPLDYSQIPTGDFYWEDGNGVFLGAWKYRAANQDLEIEDASGNKMVFIEDDSIQLLKAIGSQWKFVSYADEECQGPPLFNYGTDIVIRLDGQFFVGSEEGLDGQTLIRANRRADNYNLGTHEYDISTCNVIENPNPGSGKFLAPYDPPPEWLNAAYPLTLKQEPN